MNLPELKPKLMLQQTDLLEKLVLQLLKDFATAGLDVRFSATTNSSYDWLLGELNALIQPLFESSSSKLYALLYRIDVTDKDIAKAGLDLKDYSHSEIIAHAIILRELKKVLIREYYDTH